MRTLVLFDVDGTLIERGDPDHLGAMDYGVQTAFPDAAGATVHQVDYDGKVDRLIATEILQQAGYSLTPEAQSLDMVFDRAAAHYRKRWEGRTDGAGDLLPGVQELVEELSGRPEEFALGVLTGGTRGIVAVKLERLGLATFFPVGAFGNEVPDRPSLVPLAMRRAGEHYGEDFSSVQAVIVGDTPHDVDCAHAHGVPCLAVASGKYTMDELRDAGADAVIPSLAGSGEIIELIVGLTEARR